MHYDLSSNDRMNFLAKSIDNNASMYAKAIVRAVIARQENVNILYDARVDFSYKSDNVMKEVTHDYGRIVLAARVLEIKDVANLLNTLPSKVIDMKDLSAISIDGNPDSSVLHLASKMHYVMLFNEWAVRYFHYSGNPNVHIRAAHDPLIKVGLPTYPNLFEATQAFLGLEQKPNSNSPFGIRFILPDYRARINVLEITDNKIKMSVEGRDLNLKELVAKFFCKKGQKQNFTPEDMSMGQDGIVGFDAPFIPDEVDAYLVEKRSDDSIDYRMYGSYYTSYHEGLIVRTSAEHVLSLLDKGEGINIEFKENLNTDEFLESVVAFANTDGGSIIVGIDREGRVVGFYDDFDRAEKKIRGMVSGKCEPHIEVRVESVELQDKPVVLVHVPRGTDKPYILRNKAPYIRKGEDDVPMTRHDLDRTNEEKQSGRHRQEFI